MPHKIHTVVGKALRSQELIRPWAKRFLCPTKMSVSRGTARGFCLVEMGGSFCTSKSGVELAGESGADGVCFGGRKARYLGWAN